MLKALPVLGPKALLVLVLVILIVVLPDQFFRFSVKVVGFYLMQLVDFDFRGVHTALLIALSLLVLWDLSF